MSTKILVIVSVSIFVVMAMFVMGKMADKGDDETPPSAQ